MVSFVFTGLVGAGQPTFTTGITDLEVAWINGVPRLYAANLPGLGAGYAAFDLSGATGPAPLIALQSYSNAVGHLRAPDFAVLAAPGGPSYLVAGGQTPSGWASYGLGPGGGFGGALNSPLAFNPVAVAGHATGSDTFVFFATQGSAQPLAFRLADTGALAALGPPPGSISGPETDDLGVAATGSGTYLLSVSATANTITTHTIAANGTLGPGTQVSAQIGTGFSNPTEVASLTIQGATYAIVAASESSSLSVFRILPGGVLQNTDHVVDGLMNRFQGATALSVLQQGERGFVAVGGADGGIDIMALLPDGRLVGLMTITDSATMSLDHVSALAFAQTGSRAFLFAASATETGITQLDLNLGTPGTVRWHDAGAIHGTANNDTLGAGAATTALYGGDGNDLIVGGGAGGAAGLWGGTGSDRFILSPSAVTITIRDFQAGVDRLDLSGFPLLRNLDQITIVSTATGAELSVIGTVIRIDSHDGNPIPATAFPLAHLVPVYRFAPDSLPQTGPASGTQGNDLLQAGPGGGTLYGLAGNDTLVGSDGTDLLDGGDGNDLIRGWGGLDEIFGWAGNDHVLAGAGDDLADGGDGNDTLLGEAGDDTLNGGGGRDSINGGDGADLVSGGADNDTLLGGTGNDTVRGDAGNDQLDAGSGEDSVEGGDGDDRSLGGIGNDTLRGGTGRDWLVGDDGDDVVHGDEGDDSVAGLAGHDTLYGGSGNDVLWDTAGNDSLHGDDGNDTIYSGDGENVLAGDDGDDVLFGGSGGDQAYGGSGNDRMQLFAGNDRAYGGPGNDTISAGPGNDDIEGSNVLNGGDGNDTLYGSNGHSVLDAGAGHDLIAGGAGADLVYGADGDDRARGYGGNDTFHGGAGDDSMGGDAGNDLIFGGDGDDALWSNAGNDSLFGGDGNDVLWEEIGNDSLDGGTGNDSLWGGAGYDRLFGGDGDDQLFGGGENDVIYGGIGNDRITGGRGSDWLFGGSGSDIFVLTTAAEATLWTEQDYIVDFEPGIDRIDLRGLGLHFTGSGWTTGVRGVSVATHGQHLIVLGDTTGDGRPDFSMALLDLDAVSPGDFLL